MTSPLKRTLAGRSRALLGGRLINHSPINPLTSTRPTIPNPLNSTHARSQSKGSNSSSRDQDSFKASRGFPQRHHTLLAASLGPLPTQLLIFALASTSTLSLFYWYRSRRNSDHAIMSDTLIPSNPSDVMVIRDVTPNVVTLSVPFLRFNRIPVGGRGTIVRLSSGALAVFSPVALTPEVKAKLVALGNNLRYIIAPDIEHHIFVSEWKTAFPTAVLIGVDGLPEKRSAQNDPKIGKETFDVVFKADTKRTTSISAEFDHDFDYEYVDAHANKELVFLYKPDRVLIQADLIFNLPATEQYSRVPEKDRPIPGFLARQFIGLQTTQGDVKGLKRVIWYAFSRSNRPSFNESIKRINAWDIKIIVPCHGDVIEEGAKEAFEKVFDWHINGRK